MQKVVLESVVVGFPQKGENYKKWSPHSQCRYRMAISGITKKKINEFPLKSKSVTTLLCKKWLIPLQNGGSYEYRKESS